jgi:hypothetical protein
MKRRTLLQQSLAVATGLAAGVGLPGCIPNYRTRLQWEEDVTLGSREVIRIARDIDCNREQALGGEAAGARYWKRAILRSVAKAPLFPQWDAPLYAIYLDRDEAGVWWLIAATEDASFWRRNGEPPTSQWAFRVNGDRWVLAPVPTAYMGRQANLLVDYRPEDSNRTIEREAAGRKASPDPMRVLLWNRKVLAEKPREFERGWPQPAQYAELKSFLE